MTPGWGGAADAHGTKLTGGEAANSVDDDVLVARAYLSRVAEPACIPLHRDVARYGPVAVVADIRRGRYRDDDLRRAVAGRVGRFDPYDDLEAAARRAIRLVVPESDEWPHFGLAALRDAAVATLADHEAGVRRTHRPGAVDDDRVALIPPVALWVRGPGDLATVGLRSVGIVGARSSTPYGNGIARALARDLVSHGFAVISGGAFGIDAEAHRGALEAGGPTVLVSAGGLDRPYPRAHGPLFDEVAATGLLVSESPPGSQPQKHRFLSRNRIIASLSVGTVVVEAARRSGALNTAGSARRMGKVVMAVPGSVHSPASVGCHRLLAHDEHPAAVVTGTRDVLTLIGDPSDLAVLHGRQGVRLGAADEDVGTLRRIDVLDPTARRLLDGFPARRSATVDQLAMTAGLEPRDVMRSLPTLELAGLVLAAPGGGFRLAPTNKGAGGTTGSRAGTDAGSSAGSGSG